MSRLRAARVHPLHTNFMQHTCNDDCCLSGGRRRLQMGHSSSDLVRPFFISTSWFPAATHSSHLRMLCLLACCSRLYESSGSSRSQAPQIFMMCWRLVLSLQPTVRLSLSLGTRLAGRGDGIGRVRRVVVVVPSRARAPLAPLLEFSFGCPPPIFT